MKTLFLELYSSFGYFTEGISALLLDMAQLYLSICTLFYFPPNFNFDLLSVIGKLFDLKPSFQRVK